MSLGMHAAVLALVVLDLALGGAVVDRFAGRYATIGFEFAVILGYVLFVLRWLPWRDPGQG